jgi:hydroxymethylpyrimidine pyrophosphatase-like HAD family hydrolase
MNGNRLELYWNDIPTVKAEAVTYEELHMWWNVDKREIRKILQELSKYDNGDNYVLIRSGKNKGFYKTDDKDEIAAYKKECLNKGLSVLAPIKKINRIFAANADQYSIENNLRVIREERQLKQTQVCQFMQQFDSGFDVPMLSKMENGFCMPNYRQAALLSQLYNCEISDLINYDIFL